MDERDLERSEARVIQESQQSIRCAQRLLSEHGTAECEDCGEEISPERRKVAPFAKRCLVCQIMNEKRGRLYAK